MAVGYVSDPDNSVSIKRDLDWNIPPSPFHFRLQVVKNDFLKSGRYTLESLGNVYDANLHLRSPFDPKHLRVQGRYES